MKSLHENKNLSISCPICQTKKLIEVPVAIIDQSKHLTTISIPKGKVCEHHFQIFIDKNFIIRGFQKVDYELEEKNSEQHKKHTLAKGMSLKEIYEEFWQYISDDNEEFKNFITGDTRRWKNLHQRKKNNPDVLGLLPHVCKNLD